MFRSDYSINHINSPNIEVIKEILSNWVWEDDFTHRYFLRGIHIKNNICTYEAYENGMLVGLITAWKSEFHPSCTYFAIVTKPHIGIEIETVLIEALSNFKEIDLPLQTTIWESSYGLKTFYEKVGFLEVRRTYMPLLRTSKIDFQLVFPDFNGQDICIQDINSICNHKELKIKLINLVRENYEKAHTVNPVGVHSFQKWEELIFNEDTIKSGSFIILKDNEILAYSLLHYSNTPNHFEFGWRGTKENTDVQFMLILTASQINFAIENGVKHIEAEVDTTDYFSVEMLKFFPFSPAPTLLTFQKRTNND
ncbi:MAG: GNAT family acetyltransferase [Firmicutes bacterium]|nr:GNAT family acetyltransferase [Bacillota bacterium]